MAKIVFFLFLSENECLDGMELVYILIFFLRHKHPVIELIYSAFLRELFHFRYRRGMP